MLDKYKEIDNRYLALIEDSGMEVMAVDRSFFGTAIDEWYEEWYKKSPHLKALEKEAASF